MLRHKMAPRVHSISSVPTSVADDQSRRVRTYLLSMGIRTACFVLAVAVFLIFGWVTVSILLSIAAIVLPYPAVVMANNSANRQSHFMVPTSPVREIGTSEDQDHSPRAGEHW
ncbi:MAG: DUF3099 domain-containing protein [Dermatophilaceae bacterium]